MTIEVLVPDSDDSGWTGGGTFADIDNGISTPSGVALVASVTGGQETVLLGIVDSARTDADTINTLTLKARARTVSAQNDSLRVQLRIGGVLQGSAVDISLTGSYATHSFNDVGWNSDWTAAELDGMTWDIISRQSGMPGDRGHEVDEVEVEVDYTAGGGGQSIVVGLITENESLFAATPAPGGTSITTGLITENESLFAATPAQGDVITVGLITENVSLFAVAVLTTIAITVGQITENESLFAATPVPSNTITTGLITENESLFAATPVPDVVSITVGLITENESLFVAAPAPGGFSVTTGLITENESLFSPSISQGEVVSVGLITENESLFVAAPVPGGTNIVVGLITENESLFSATPVQVQIISVGLITENESLFVTTPVPGVTSITVGLITENELLFVTTPAPGGVSVTTGQITENESLFAASVTEGDVVSVGLITENESLFAVSVEVVGEAPGVKMADPRTPGRERASRKPRQKHPAWREMEIRLKREYEAERDKKVQIVEIELEEEPPVDYLQVLIGKRDQVQDDIDAIEDRLEDLETMRSDDNATQLEIKKDIETAQLFLDLAKRRELAQAQLIAAIKAVILYYYY